MFNNQKSPYLKRNMGKERCKVLSFCGLCVLLVLFFSFLSTPSMDIFLVVGDFGVDPNDPVFSDNYKTSEILFRSMNRIAANYAFSFSRSPTLLLTGDLVYPSGVQSMEDVRINQLFERFPPVLKKSDMYAVPGNHDCEGIISPIWSMHQKRFPQWKPSSTMNALFGETRIKLSTGGTLRLVSFETCSMVCSHWNQSVNFRCAGENMLKYTKEQEYFDLHASQRKWMDSQLFQKKSSLDWLIVMGHFPLFSFRGNGPTKELEPLLQWMRSMNADVYLSGHDHALQHIVTKHARDPHFLVSGAGGYPLHAELKDTSLSVFNTKNEAQLVHVQDAAGFMSLEVARQQLTLKFFDVQGQITYSTTIQRKR